MRKRERRRETFKVFGYRKERVGEREEERESLSVQVCMYRCNLLAQVLYYIAVY